MENISGVMNDLGEEVLQKVKIHSKMLLCC
jgi:hypothetical protein